MQQGPSIGRQRCRALATLLLTVAALGLPAAGRAQDQTAPLATASGAGDTASTSVAFDIAITISADGTSETVETRRVTVLADAAIQNVGQIALNYIEGMQTLEVLEAYTQKQDGRSIPVEPAKIITRDAASANVMHLRDHKVSTVVFSDVAVGDTVVLTSRKTIMQEIFPGYVQGRLVFSSAAPISDSIVRVVAPKNLPLKVAIYGEGLDHEAVSDAEVTRHVIAYHARPRRAAEAGATSPMDRDPRIFFSTLKDYEELARLYWEAASPQALVTPEIEALVDTITRGISDRRAQAEAIDRWIKTNIRYVAIYLGVGRVVPYSAASVLKNKYGDCKDQVTLMSALLAAKGIASEHALISASTAYTLPEPPTMAYINHVLVYLPEFDLYDDPTASAASFGVLAQTTYDKPVIHVSASGARRAHTPAMQPQDHRTINRTRINVAADGTVTGETEQIATGAFATTLRAAATRFQNAGLETSAQQLLRSFNTPGKARFGVAALSALTDSYSVKSRFTLNDPMQITPGRAQAIPFGLPVHRRPGEFLLSVRYPGRQAPFVCYAGSQVEEIEVVFAETLLLPRPLRGRTVEHRLFSYTSSYRMENRTLRIRREFVSRVPGQVCSPELENEIAGPLKEVRGSVLTRMIFAAGSDKPPMATEPAISPPVPPMEAGAGANPGSD